MALLVCVTSSNMEFSLFSQNFWACQNKSTVAIEIEGENRNKTQKLNYRLLVLPFSISKLFKIFVAHINPQSTPHMSFNIYNIYEPIFTRLTADVSLT